MKNMKMALKKHFIMLTGLVALTFVMVITLTMTLVNNNDKLIDGEMTQASSDSGENNRKDIYENEKSLSGEFTSEDVLVYDLYALSDEAMRSEILERYQIALDANPIIEVGTENINLLTASKSNVEGTRDSQGNIIVEETYEPLVQYESPTTDYSDVDYDALLRIVEAEATDEDVIGKIMVANVVINRVYVSGFPNNIYDVIHQSNDGVYQFSPIKDGRYFTVPVTQTTIDAVARALSGEDYSNGALFFVARSLASENAVSWFDRNLEKVAVHGCHEFFAYPSE